MELRTAPSQGHRDILVRPATRTGPAPTPIPDAATFRFHPSKLATSGHEYDRALERFKLDRAPLPMGQWG